MHFSAEAIAQLELALQAPFNRRKKVKQQFRSIFVRVLNENAEGGGVSDASTKREVILKHFLKLASYGDREATESILTFLYNHEKERSEEESAERTIDKTLLEVARKNGN